MLLANKLIALLLQVPFYIKFLIMYAQGAEILDINAMMRRPNSPFSLILGTSHFNHIFIAYGCHSTTGMIIVLSPQILSQKIY